LRSIFQPVRPQIDDDIEDGKPITSIMGVGRDDLFPSSITDLDNKSTLPSNSGNDLSDTPSTSASAATTMSSMLSGQQKKMKPFKLVDAIKPIEYDEMQRMSTDSFYRILHAEGLLRLISKYFSTDLYLDVCEGAGVGHVRKKTMTSLVCLSERSFRDSK
jgi:hypothetical protein